MSNSESQRNIPSALSEHVVICNWSPKADTIIRELHNESVHNKRPILIITSEPELVPETTDFEYNGVYIVNGNPTEKGLLERANVESASTVIILADENNHEYTDSESTLISLAVGAINPDAYIIVEIINSSNLPYFEYTFVNEIICLEKLSEKLLSQSALTPGLSQVYMDLLTQSSDTNEIYLENLPERFIGLTFDECENKIIDIKEKDMILIGFYSKKENKTVINPKSSDKGLYSKSYILEKEDRLFLIAYEKPELNKFSK